MCGVGDSENNKLEIYLGYYGCYLELDKEFYNPQNNKNLWGKSIDKQTMIDKIKKNYDYDDFINAILECVENGGED